MNELSKYFIDEYKKKLKVKRENGPIDMTADQLWKYSGKTEQTSENYKHLILESRRFKARKLPVKSRKEYFKSYWVHQKQKQLRHETRIKESETERSC